MEADFLLFFGAAGVVGAVWFVDIFGISRLSFPVESSLSFSRLEMLSLMISF